MKPLPTSISLTILMLLISGTLLSQYQLQFKVTGFKNKKGRIAVALYNNENQYTDNPYKNYKAEKSTMVNDTVTVIIDNLPAGVYAISFLDDENANNKMDYSFIGIPQEGFGFANNAKPGFLSPPDYEDCQFTLKENLTLSANVQYWSD